MYTGAYKPMKKAIIEKIITISAIIFIIDGILGLTLLPSEKLTLFWQIIFIFNIIAWSGFLGYFYDKNR